MSLPTTAPASHASSSTDARQVSTEMATSKRSRSAAMGAHHPVELLGLADLGAGPGLHPADVEQVGALRATSASARRKEGVELERAPWS